MRPSVFRSHTPSQFNINGEIIVHKKQVSNRFFFKSELKFNQQISHDREKKKISFDVSIVLKGHIGTVI